MHTSRNHIYRCVWFLSMPSHPLLVLRAKGSIGQRILGSSELDRLVKDAQQSLADDAEIIFASFALHRTGRMGRGIHTVQDGRSLLVVVEARDPVTGFDYVRITRFGHKTFKIVPKARSAATVIDTRKKRARGRRAMLRWVQTDGGVIYRHSSRGFHPVTDWASEAVPAVRRAASQNVAVLAKRIKLAWDGEK